MDSTVLTSKKLEKKMSKRLSREAIDRRNMALVSMGYPLEEPRQVSRLLRKERVQGSLERRAPLPAHSEKRMGGLPSQDLRLLAIA
jgi:hypothetical protein